MLDIIVIVLVLAVAGALVYAAMQPDDFRIERSNTVNAPPERIYLLTGHVRLHVDGQDGRAGFRGGARQPGGGGGETGRVRQP